ncbi:hypothetical protein KIPB_003408 [Kipferlia bialata]|uniref:Uncharacterized protein n=1 Tax=Kipferlia bialata TaxID=797122 RepID=A0A9K3CU11_9EUKA|nr:hypothetical protein KIPB_001464 [Kipferlia bialata]GIQ82298.1 hypothetical protein KIPB_003408 [Kipferlia bialata]|eukprot:g1464.t1
MGEQVSMALDYVIDSVDRPEWDKVKRLPGFVEQILDLNEPYLEYLRNKHGLENVVSLGPNSVLALTRKYTVFLSRPSPDAPLALEGNIHHPKQGWTVLELVVGGGFVVALTTPPHRQREGEGALSLSVLDLATLVWERVTPTPSYPGQTLFHDWPCPRRYPTGVDGDGHLVVIGGWGYDTQKGRWEKKLRDTWVFETEQRRWRRCDDIPADMGHRIHACSFGDSIQVFSDHTRYTFHLERGWERKDDVPQLVPGRDFSFYCSHIQRCGQYIVIADPSKVYTLDTISGEFEVRGFHSLSGGGSCSVDADGCHMLSKSQCETVLFDPGWVYPHDSLKWARGNRITVLIGGQTKEEYRHYYGVPTYRLEVDPRGKKPRDMTLYPF